MKDEQIVALFWQRDEEAIQQTKEKYEHYLLKVARGVLASDEDSREVVNDTFLRAWETIPPNRPAYLGAFLAKIAREKAIDRLRMAASAKRAGSEYLISLEELEECGTMPQTEETQIDADLLAACIGEWLKTQKAEVRNLFIGRYFYADSIAELAGYYGMSESKVKSLLHRARGKLRLYLRQEGYDV